MAQHHPREDRLPRAGLRAVALISLVAAGHAGAQVSGDGEEAVRQCSSCHGPRGIATKAGVPHLAGQLSRYTLNQLRNYASGQRSDPTMEPLARALSLHDMQVISAYYAGQTMVPTGFQADPSKVERGKRKFSEANCTYCHRSATMGIAENPRLAGQSYAYVVRQLLNFKHEKRTTNPNMTAATRLLTEQEIDDLAEFFASALQ
jgi:cytochrome c553